jgi:outer membrane protein TolC
MNRTALLLLLAATAAPTRSALADDAPRTLTLKAAVEVALAKNPDLALAREAIAGAEAKTAGVKARRIAGLRVDFAGNFYREAYLVAFGASALTLHEQTTTATIVTLAQPLTGLAYLSELVGAAGHEVAAARDEYDHARLDVAYRTAEAYLRLLEAQASAAVAHRTVADFDSGLARALQLRAADSYTDVDVLRFRAAKAGADQAVIRADAAVEAARANLVLQLGLHDGTPVDVTDDLPAEPPPLVQTVAQAQDRALSARPELRAAREHLQAADNGRRAAREEYLPEINAVGVWQHMTGVQPFQPKDEEFLGLRLSWKVWDWGATHQGVLAAEHDQTRAALKVDIVADQVRLDVRKRWLDARTSYDSLAAARTQQQTAEEAHRLQQVRFDNAAATATDVLDADTEAAKAALGFALARYDYYLAVVALARAVGDLPAP